MLEKKVIQGNGLMNIKHRVEEVNGQLEIISKPGFGTTIITRFPPKD
ncbi:MAG: hypothetical protein LRY71_03185 [Bacillaceae bacterium]|nr:hypothetical protein [Bacillaceae bacterium]